MRRLILFNVLYLLIISCNSSNEWLLKSPDNNIKIAVTHTNNGSVNYTVIGANETEHVLINPSNLGLSGPDTDFSDALTFVSASEIIYKQESYTAITGKRRENWTQYNQLDIAFRNSANKELKIEFRAYNGGVAFRYSFCNPLNDKNIITDELTEFSVNPDGFAWMQEYDWWSPPYERLYQNKIYIGTVSPRHREDGWSYPALFNTNNYWMLVTEAGLNESYCATHIKNNEDSPVYKVSLATKEMGYRAGPVDAKITTPWHSPWRVIIIGSLKDIVESNLVNHLSQPNQIENTDWIIPGKSSWSWLYNTSSPRNCRALKKYIDLSSEMGWRYSLIDANWNEMTGCSILDLIEYAKMKNVGLFLWYNSGGKHNEVTEQPRDIMDNPERRRREFKKLHEMGVKGVKIDFFNSDKQDIIKLYLDILKDAADYEIMVNFHGCTLPRGWSRTYPNLVTMEAVKGAEWYLSEEKEFIYQAGRHNTILPFTRNVVGPMDYTPVNFSYNNLPHETTFAHELALSVVFESTVQHFGDTYESYMSLPSEVKSFLTEVPTTWDETVFIDGYPGKYFIIGRKKNNNWYIGGINGYFVEEVLNVNLTFLGEQKCQIELIKDGVERNDFGFQYFNYPETTEIAVTCPREGGFVMLVRPTK